jgi:hypothetical protein
LGKKRLMNQNEFGWVLTDNKLQFYIAFYTCLLYAHNKRNFWCRNHTQYCVDWTVGCNLLYHTVCMLANRYDAYALVILGKSKQFIKNVIRR